MAVHKIRPEEPEGGQAVVMMPCQNCGQPTRHYSVGVQPDPLGNQQSMKCAECGTNHFVYTGEGGKDFQSNVDAPADTEREADE